MFLQIPAIFLISGVVDRELNLSITHLPVTQMFFFLFQGSLKDPKKIQKTMSSGDLGKVEVLRKTSSQDGR